MGKILTAIAPIALLAGLCSCNSNGCLDNQNSIPLAGFYSMTSLQPVSVTKMQIGGVNAPGDSLILSSGSASQIYLPFRASANESAFYFHLVTDADSVSPDTRNNDTITFRYKAIPYFASSECGAMFQYEITEYSHTSLFIDSVAVTDSLITNTDIQRIEIYFRDSSPDEDTEEPVTPSGN